MKMEGDCKMSEWKRLVGLVTRLREKFGILIRDQTRDKAFNKNEIEVTKTLQRHLP